MLKNNAAVANGLTGKKKILLLLLTVVVIAGGVFAAFEMFGGDRAGYNRTRNTFLPHISVNGLDIGGMTYNDALDAIVLSAQQRHREWSLEISCNDFTYSTINYNTLGVTVDCAAIEAALYEAWTYGHKGDYKSYVQDAEKLQQQPHSVFVSMTEGNAENVDYILDVIAQNVYRAPVDAQVVFDATRAQDPFVYTQEIPGQRVNVEQVREEILGKAMLGEKGKYVIALESIAPEVTVEMLKADRQLLSTGKNAIDKYSTKERNENIRLAFSSINGYVLENKATFSFNKVVGNRTVEAGYLPAMGYVSGQLVEVVGGGVCQVSTTLYSAALCAGLTIRERTPHSMPVSYIELGQDATVNYMRGHMIDLKFKNETGYPVYLTAAIEENAMGRLMSVVRVFGHALEDDVHYQVESVEIETLPIPEEVVVRVDKEGQYVKYSDQTYRYSKGSEGHVVNTYLQKLRGSVVIEEKLISTDTYKAQPIIDYIGAQKRPEK